MFYNDCCSATDGRQVLRNRDNLGRLLKDKYTGGGKSWNQWECRVLSTTEKRQLLARLSSQPEPLAVAEPALLPSMGIPDFGRVTIGAAGEQRIDARSSEDEISTTHGSLEVSF